MDMRKKIEATGVRKDPDGPDMLTTVTAEVFVSLHQNASGGQVTWGVDEAVRVTVEFDNGEQEPEPEINHFRLSQLTAYQRRLLDAAILEWVIDEQLSTGGV
jgi:hypothetical protein